MRFAFFSIIISLFFGHLNRAHSQDLVILGATVARAYLLSTVPNGSMRDTLCLEPIGQPETGASPAFYSGIGEAAAQERWIRRLERRLCGVVDLIEECRESEEGCLEEEYLVEEAENLLLDIERAERYRDELLRRMD